MRFLNLPTPDRGVPGVQDFEALSMSLQVRCGPTTPSSFIAVWASGGPRLWPLVCSCWKACPSRAAWESVASAHGLDVPDTQEQKQWLDSVMTNA